MDQGNDKWINGIIYLLMLSYNSTVLERAEGLPEVQRHWSICMGKLMLYLNLCNL